jgi:hypothetical protein
MFVFSMSIPIPLEDTRFRNSERFIIKAYFFIKGYSGECAPAFSNKLHSCSALKNKYNDEYDLLSFPQRAGLETLYVALLIEENNYSLQSMPYLKAFLIPAESCIFKWNGYSYVVTCVDSLLLVNNFNIKGQITDE